MVVSYYDCGNTWYAGALNFDGLESGYYRIQLCEGWSGCSDVDEYIGYNNKSCIAGVPPLSKEYGNTVGPVLRNFEESERWKTWDVDVLSKTSSEAEVTLKNKYTGPGKPRCKNHYIVDYSEKKDACKDTEWAPRVHLHKEKVKWILKPVAGSDECFNIINAEKPEDCWRYLSADSDCENRYLRLSPSDDGSGLQRWKFAPSTDGGQPPLQPSPEPQTEKPTIISTQSGSSVSGAVTFAPPKGASSCTVIETPEDGGPSIQTVINHLSFPYTATHPVGLNPDSVYIIEVKCVVNGQTTESAKENLHTPGSNAQPGITNLHPTSSSGGSFDIVKPNASICDAIRYDVFAKPSSGDSVSVSTTKIHVDLKDLKPGVSYEITVDAVCKDGSTTEKSAPAFLSTPLPPSESPPPPPPPPSQSPLPSPSLSPSPPPLQIPSPNFHTINIFGPHPTVSVYVDKATPDGSTVALKVACTDGFTTSVSHAVSKPETIVQLPTGLPAGTNCTFTSSVENSSGRSEAVRETRIVPTRAQETPHLERWTPNYQNQSAQVTIIAPQKPSCTISSYTLTSVVLGSRFINNGRKLLQSTATPSVSAQAPGPVTITNVLYSTSSTKAYNLSVVGNCDDGSKTPEGHLSVNAVCPQISNCESYNNDGTCGCRKCSSGFIRSGYQCIPEIIASPPPSPPPVSSYSFVEFRGDGDFISDGSRTRFTYSFTPTCGTGSTITKSTPLATAQCGWERAGTTYLSAVTSNGLQPGTYQYTVKLDSCSPQEESYPSCQDAWTAYMFVDFPVSGSCPQTDGAPSGVCRKSFNLKQLCGGSCDISKGVTVPFLVDQDGKVSAP